MFSRRDIAGLATLLFSASAAKAAPPAETATHVDAPARPANWTGSEEIAVVIYSGFTALDVVGPHYMFTSLKCATTHIVAKSAQPVSSDTGLTVVPTRTFDDCPEELDVLCVGGGTAGTLAAMQDEPTVQFLAARGRTARYVTSVCTGSLLLGAAGLLAGYRATSHWLTRDLLPIFGAIPTDGRVVVDRNRITGAGVTAGVDLGLSLVGELRGRPYAEAVQLLAEYAPEPPFQSGTRDSATPATRRLLDGLYADFRNKAEVVSRSVANK